ncbi:hypothetical protein [Clostridium autoethanogenum]|nr:hypothetical protein [Clostridium autoethanogenum]
MDYICDNEIEFIGNSSEILISDKVTEIIEVLYLKRKNIEVAREYAISS